MFSTGHLIWIGICFALIIIGLTICAIVKPTLKRLFKVCFGLGLVSEVVKVFSVSVIVPVVDPVIVEKNGEQVIEWTPIGQYTPYLAKEHLPLELCSLFLIFMLAAILIKDEVWKKRLYAVMYTSGTIGGLMGIVLASITAYYDTTMSYFTSPRAWQFFLYHAMIVMCALYLGFCKESGLRFGDWKKAVVGILILDLPTYYLNSVLSSEVYVNDKPVGVTHGINYFSSYINPLGLVLTEKWQWIAYVAIRFILAVLLIILMYLPLIGRGRKDNKLEHAN